MAVVTTIRKVGEEFFVVFTEEQAAELGLREGVEYVWFYFQDGLALVPYDPQLGGEDVFEEEFLRKHQGEGYRAVL
jgi:hypothetical protein